MWLLTNAPTARVIAAVVLSECVLLTWFAPMPQPFRAFDFVLCVAAFLSGAHRCCTSMAARIR
jgi:hypothetical protein